MIHHDTDSGRSETHSEPDAGRRQFLRTVGAGALTGCLAGAASGVAAHGVAAQDGDSGPRTEGIEDWSLSQGSTDSSASDEPTVGVEDDDVVVTGSYLANDSCVAVRPVRLVYSPDLERLGAVLETYSEGGADQACLDVVQTREYELRITPEALPESVVVAERFSDAGPSVHHLGNSPGPELPTGVADYALEVGESVTPDEARDIGPSVTFEGSDAVVEGALTYGSSSCREIGVAAVDLVDGANGEVAVALAPRMQPTYVPGNPCTGDVAAARYSLTLAAADDASIDRVIATEDGPQSTQKTDATRGEDDGDGPIDLPPEVADYEFAWDDEVDLDFEDDDPASVEPRVTFAEGDVVIEGLATYGSPSCDELAVTDVGRVYGTAGHVSASVEARPAREYDATCDTLGGVAPYRLRLIGSGEEPIDRCTVHESAELSEHDRTVEETDDRLEYPETVSGHRLEIDRSIEREHPVDDVEAPPTVRAETAEDGSQLVVLEGTANAGSSTCGTLHVGDLAGTAGLSEDVSAGLQVSLVETEHRSEFTGCTADVVYADYRLELAVEELPDLVTASEQPRVQGEPVRRRSVELDGDDGPELPPGVVDYSVTLERQVGQDVVQSSPDVLVAIPSGDANATVEIEGGLLVGPCESFEVADVRWTDEQSHLAVTVDAATDESALDESGECAAGAPASRTGYTVELEIEPVPALVTAEEQLDDAGDPLRSTTKGVGVCADARHVDGQRVCDVDADDLYCDVNGDGEVTHADVQAFFDVQHRPAWKQPSMFDFNGNEVVGHGDVIALFEDVASGSL